MIQGLLTCSPSGEGATGRAGYPCDSFSYKIHLIYTVFGPANTSIWTTRLLRDRVEHARELTRRLLPEAVEAGVKVCLATDSTHATLWREAKCFVGLGLSEAEALKAVTVNGAEMLGLADQVGEVEAGKLADLIAIEGNPLEDIEALREVKMVMKAGVVVHEEEAP